VRRRRRGIGFIGYAVVAIVLSSLTFAAVVVASIANALGIGS
jgi:uncharacterized membrane protein